MARDYADRIGFLGVPGLGTVDAMEGFVEGFGVGQFPHVVDRDGSLWARFGVPYQPAWVFVDSKGNSVRVSGAIPEPDLISILEDLAADRLPD